MNSLTTNSQEISQVSPTATPLDSLSSLGQGLVKQLLAMDKAGKEAVKPLLPKEIQELIENGTEKGREIVTSLLEGDRKGKDYIFGKKENENTPNILPDEDFDILMETIRNSDDKIKSYFNLIDKQEENGKNLSPEQLEKIIKRIEEENKVFFYHYLLIEHPKKYKLTSDQVDRLINSMSDKNTLISLNLMLIQYQNNLTLSDEVYTLTSKQVDLLIKNMSDGDSCKSLIMMQKRLNYTLTPLQVDVLVTKILDSTISPAGCQELIMGQEDFGYSLTSNQIDKLDIKMKGLDKKKTMIRKEGEQSPLGNFGK